MAEFGYGTVSLYASSNLSVLSLASLGERKLRHSNGTFQSNVGLMLA